MIDPRAYSDEKIDPIAPLPYVSRHALMAVKNPLPMPTECNCCGGNRIVLIDNRAIYGKSIGRWPYAFRCLDCGAYVGLHPNTDTPLGTLADYELRECRKMAKQSFHMLMDLSGAKRKDLYRWLAWEMNISEDVCHFAWFDKNQANTARFICDKQIALGEY